MTKEQVLLVVQEAIKKNTDKSELGLAYEQGFEDGAKYALKKLEQCSVSGWRAFEDELPKPMQEIFIFWPSGNFQPEYRMLTEDDLKQEWSMMRWMPVPAYH